jgi:hypothetical protein
MKRLILPLVAALGLSSAYAAGGGGHGGEASKPAGAPSLDLPPFMAPVTVRGELRYYLYVVIKLDLTSDFKKPVVLEKVPYLQDALLRHVHRTPTAPAEGSDNVDETAFAAGLKPILEGVLGPDVVAQVGFRTLTRAAH